jgi:FKBP-type peptidyl-prolyl cis-trans isomerase FkpA
MSRLTVSWNQSKKKKKKKPVQQKTFKGGLCNTDIFAKFYSKMGKIILALFVVSAVMSGCAKNSSSFTCSYDPCAIQAPASEITQLESYLSGAGITTATKHCSGMYYEIKSPGSGAAPTTCSYVSVNYKGMLTNGTVFDQTTSNPVAFTLITLIESWKKGIPLLKKGGSITLYVPPSLGYGAVDQKDKNGTTIIPANSILIFDIQLVDVQ